jgi:Tol biopolymer transport system component
VTPSPIEVTATGTPLAQRRIAFVREDGVYVAHTTGAREERITEGIPGFEYQPDWSPDGGQLLLRVDYEDSGRVWVVNADGTDAVDLSERSGVPGGVPDWSPDGDQIVFIGKTKREQFFGIYVMDADGSHPQRITPDDWEAQYPDWSPDGNRIIFTRVEDGGFDIYVINVDGSGLTRLTDDPADDNWPQWSPDGSQVVFSSTREVPDGGLHLMRWDGSDQRFLTEGGEPAWSSDG